MAQEYKTMDATKKKDLGPVVQSPIKLTLD